MAVLVGLARGRALELRLAALFLLLLRLLLLRPLVLVAGAALLCLVWWWPGDLLGGRRCWSKEKPASTKPAG
jgi:hypothetical protein